MLAGLFQGICREIQRTRHNEAVNRICKEPDDLERIALAFTKKISGVALYDRVHYLSQQGQKQHISEMGREVLVSSYQDPVAHLTAITATSISKGGCAQDVCLIQNNQPVFAASIVPFFYVSVSGFMDPNPTWVHRVVSETDRMLQDVPLGENKTFRDWAGRYVRVRYNNDAYETLLSRANMEATRETPTFGRKVGGKVAEIS